MCITGQCGRDKEGGGEVGVQPREVQCASAPHNINMERWGTAEVLRQKKGIPTVRLHFVVCCLLLCYCLCLKLHNHEARVNNLTSITYCNFLLTCGIFWRLYWGVNVFVQLRQSPSDSGGLSYPEVEVSVTILRIKYKLQKVDVHIMLKINLLTCKTNDYDILTIFYYHFS